MFLHTPERRFFCPKRTDDLVSRAIPFVNKWVTVDGWHENISMTINYPNDQRVGFVYDFSGDIPESELLTFCPGEPHDCDGCDGNHNN